MLPFVREIAGPDRVIQNEKHLPGSEGFGYVSEQVPGIFLTLGAGSKEPYPMKNPNMVLDESVFALGAAVLANCAFEWLKKQSEG